MRATLHGHDRHSAKKAQHQISRMARHSRFGEAGDLAVWNSTSVFDAFFTTKPQGTGLGLPIARTIIQTYGGTIWAENRDRSAVFSFRLPLAKVVPGRSEARIDAIDNKPVHLPLRQAR